MEVNTTTTTDPINMYNSVNNIMLNPIVFIILFFIPFTPEIGCEPENHLRVFYPAS